MLDLGRLRHAAGDVEEHGVGPRLAQGLGIAGLPAARGLLPELIDAEPERLDVVLDDVAAVQQGDD
jgi:hypothetical protein